MQVLVPSCLPILISQSTAQTAFTWIVNVLKGPYLHVAQLGGGRAFRDGPRERAVGHPGTPSKEMLGFWPLFFASWLKDGQFHPAAHSHHDALRHCKLKTRHGSDWPFLLTW